MGDREDHFQQIAARNRRRLQGLARSFASAADRDDLYQDMLLQIWRSLASFDGRSATDTWVYRVALNTALSHRRQVGVRAKYAAPGVDITADHVTGRSAGGRGEMEILQEFIATLGDVDRAVFALYLDDITYREIAEVTGLSESHVGVRIHQMKQRFTATYLGA
jgi:RNA polymerase sigma-70 factor, ECF subfamily